MLVSSNIDVADQEFIVGTTTRGTVSLAQVLSDAEARGATGPEVDQLEQDWSAGHIMCTFNQAVEQAIHKSSIGDKDSAYKMYLTVVEGKSNNEARTAAADILGDSVFWDCDRESCHSLTGMHS